MTDEPNGTPIPEPEGDEIWDEIEAKEGRDFSEIPEDGPVVIRQSELDELGEFLKAVQDLLLAHEERLGNVENALGEMIKEAQEFEAALREAYGDGEGESGTDGETQPSIVDGSGNPIDAGGTEVPGDDS